MLRDLKKIIKCLPLLNEVFMVLQPLLWLPSFAAHSGLDTMVSSSGRTQILLPGHLGKPGPAVRLPFPQSEFCPLGEITVTDMPFTLPPDFSH